MSGRLTVSWRIDMSILVLIIVVVFLSGVFAAPTLIFNKEASFGEKLFGFFVLIVEIFFAYMYFS